MTMYLTTSKLVDNLTSLTASEQVSTFEDDELQDALPTSLWRSTSARPYLVGKFDQSRTISLLSMWYLNATSDDHFRLRLADTEAELTSGPNYDKYFYAYPSTSENFFGVISFSATGDVDFGNILDQTTGSFSFQIRVKQTQASGLEYIVSKKSTIANTAGFILYTNTTSLIARISEGTATYQVVAAAALSSSEFRTVTVVVNRSTDVMYLYVGTTLVDSVDISAIGGGSLTNANNLLLAALGATQSTVDVDDFRFWSKALVAADLASGGDADVAAELDPVNLPSGLELYCRFNYTGGDTSGAAEDESGNGYDGTITNGTRYNDAPTTYPSVLDNKSSIHTFRDITDTSALWFRIDFNFTDNTAGYVQMAALMFDDAELTISNKHMSPVRVDTTTRGMDIVELGAGGQDRSNGGYKLSAEVDCRGMTYAEFWGTDGLEDKLRERAGSGVVGMILDGSEATYPQSKMFYGYLDVGQPLELPESVEVTLSITEP